MAKQADSEARQWAAIHRFARISPRKVRLVVDLIRGLDCNRAMDVLRFQHQRAAPMISKVLRSAMANADEQEANMGKLFVCEARVDGGPFLPRFRPKDRGRAHSIQRKMSHIVVKVAER